MRRRRCRRCGRNRAERFYTSRRGTVCSTCRKKARSDALHEARVRAVYGLGPGEYALLLHAQGGVCAICGQSRARRLSVDHCHRTGVVRGLLCQRCNLHLLGRGAGDDPRVLRAAAAYLEDPPAVRLLGVRTAPRGGPGA